MSLAEHKASGQFLAKIHQDYPEAEVLLTIPVAWTGWELDYEAALIRQGRNAFLVSTDHGRLVRMPVRDLTEKLEEYRRWIELTEKAVQRWQEEAEK